MFNVYPFAIVSYDLNFICRCFTERYLMTFCSSNMDQMPHKIYGYGGCITLKIKSSGDSYFCITYTDMANSETDFSGKMQVRDM